MNLKFYCSIPLIFFSLGITLFGFKNTYIQDHTNLSFVNFFLDKIEYYSRSRSSNQHTKLKSDHATYILRFNIDNTYKTKLLIYKNVNATTLTAFKTR